MKNTNPKNSCEYSTLTSGRAFRKLRSQESAKNNAAPSAQVITDFVKKTDFQNPKFLMVVHPYILNFSFASEKLMLF